MIVARWTSSLLMDSVRRAARPDEDVVRGLRAPEALRLGFPRAAILCGSGRMERIRPEAASMVPVLILDADRLERWEEERLFSGAEMPPERIRYVASRIHLWLERHGSGPTWVDLWLRDLGRAAGTSLPAAFRGMARRVLEFPSAYRDLAALGRVGGLSAGALKARFRRRGLASPYTYLRRLRCVAVAHILSDPSVTTLEAAHRVGASSSGNLCRSVQDTVGLTPTRLRSAGGRERVLVEMAEELAVRSTLQAWHDLSGVFLEAA